MDGSKQLDLESLGRSWRRIYWSTKECFAEPVGPRLAAGSTGGGPRAYNIESWDRMVGTRRYLAGRRTCRHGAEYVGLVHHCFVCGTAIPGMDGEIASG